MAYLDRALTNLHERKKSEYKKEADSSKLGSIFRWYRSTAGKWILDSYARPTVTLIHPALISAACLYATEKTFMNYQYTRRFGQIPGANPKINTDQTNQEIMIDSQNRQGRPTGEELLPGGILV